MHVAWYNACNDFKNSFQSLKILQSKIFPLLQLYTILRTIICTLNFHYSGILKETRPDLFRKSSSYSPKPTVFPCAFYENLVSSFQIQLFCKSYKWCRYLSSVFIFPKFSGNNVVYLNDHTN